MKITFEQREGAIGMLTPGMSARVVARYSNVDNKSTTEQISANWNVADRSRSGRPRKTASREDRFLTTSSRRNRFLSSRKLGRLLRNATGTRQDSQE